MIEPRPLIVVLFVGFRARVTPLGSEVKSASTKLTRKVRAEI